MVPARRAFAAMVQPPRVSASDRGREPGDEPLGGREPGLGDCRGAERQHSHPHPAPPRDGGERGGPLHRLPDEAEVVHGPGVEGRVVGGRVGTRWGEAMGFTVAGASRLHQVLYSIK